MFVVRGEVVGVLEGGFTKCCRGELAKASSLSSPARAACAYVCKGRRG